MNAKLNFVSDHLHTTVSNRNFRNADFSKADLRYFNFLDCDLRGADFSSANLTGANFYRVKTGITPTNKSLIFVATTIIALAASLAGVMAAETFQTMFTSTNELHKGASILAIHLTFIFLVIGMWKGIGNSLKVFALAVLCVVAFTGILTYITASGDGILVLYLGAYLLLILAMVIIGAIARVTAGSLADSMFIVVSLASASFANSLGGAIGTMMVGLACAVISKRALDIKGNFGAVKKLAVFVTERFGTSFRNSTLRAASFYRCKIYNADFSGADGKFVDWNYCEHANCIAADLPSQETLTLKHMKNSLGILLALAASLMTTSCDAPLKVTRDYDRTANFSTYKTFEMLELQGEGRTLSELNADRIIGAVKAQMLAKGFEERDNDADLKVHAIAIMKDKQEMTANTNYYGYGGAYRPYGWGSGGSYTTVDVNDYTDGSIIIELIDSKNGKLVWEGVGNKKIDSPSKDTSKTIPEAVKKIMQDFPPSESKKGKK